jgi:hypothetical protein
MRPMRFIPRQMFKTKRPSSNNSSHGCCGVVRRISSGSFWSRSTAQQRDDFGKLRADIRGRRHAMKSLSSVLKERSALFGFALVLALAIFFRCLPLARALGVDPGTSPESATTRKSVLLAQATGGNQASPGECKVTGCSGQVCADKDVVTTCEWKPEYACYKSARCERQTDEKCGWTMTPELIQCLKNPSSVK